MNAPTPALVRAALKPVTAQTVAEKRAYSVDGRRTQSTILRDHITAVAAEMRDAADNWPPTDSRRKDLHAFADKLEGKQ